LEARAEFGGRIRTAIHAGQPFDLGPSWIWPNTQPRIARLIAGQLAHYAQHTVGEVILESADGLFTRQLHHRVDPRCPRRLQGGTSALTDTLVASLPADRLLLSHQVRTITQEGTQIHITAESPSGPTHFAADKIILALPPRLLAQTITFTPPLPSAVMKALRATPTWMAGEAKFFALFDKPFWRPEGLSGSAYSEVGPLAEVHDATLPHGRAALLGFLLPDHQERLRLGDNLIPDCLAQLVRTFGSAASAPSTTILHDWSTESFTATAMDVSLLEHPAYGLPPPCHHLWNNRLRFAGTEAAPDHGGSLEGALEAAERAVAD
jgi:monoamine oxidase